MKLKLLISIFLMYCYQSLTASADNPKIALQWQPWEASLTTSSPAGTPITLDIKFTGPGGKIINTHAFTDDGRVYTFRIAFPDPGTWTWLTSCSDVSQISLHNKSGKIKVSRYKGVNPLYVHGDLKVSDDKRYLVHADGTPFLWMGDTGWNATFKGTMSEWKEYVDTRAAQGFSVIQISPRGLGNRNLAAESAEVGFMADGAHNPAFWKDLEDKIAYANGKGIFIVMVGIGNAWRDQTAKRQDNQKFESYITGRMASLMVAFSPSFDQLYIDELNKVLEVIQPLTTKLVTQHPGTNYEANVKYRNSGTDFAGEQSGHHAGNIVKVYNAARQWTLDLWNATPVKPVIDIEGMYDAYGNDTGGKNWREKDVRKCGWIAWMSGSRGYTYGCGDVPPKVPSGNGGVWRFNKDSSKYDYWRNAIKWPSAGQMTIMRDFFRSVEWWKLVPVHELILNQSENDTLKMVVSKSSDSNLLIAYLPDNNSVKINLKDFSGSYAVEWMNPKSGIKQSGGTINGGNGNQEFKRPDGWEDAVLKLQK
jgi:hypothetical protein